MESNAFSRIAEENMQGLYRLSFSILHTRHDAQDAVQQGLPVHGKDGRRRDPNRFAHG